MKQWKKRKEFQRKYKDRNEKDNKTKEKVNFNKFLNINELGQM